MYRRYAILDALEMGTHIGRGTIPKIRRAILEIVFNTTDKLRPTRKLWLHTHTRVRIRFDSDLFFSPVSNSPSRTSDAPCILWRMMVWVWYYTSILRDITRSSTRAKTRTRATRTQSHLGFTYIHRGQQQPPHAMAQRYIRGDIQQHGEARQTPRHRRSSSAHTPTRAERAAPPTRRAIPGRICAIAAASRVRGVPTGKYAHWKGT